MKQNKLFFFLAVIMCVSFVNAVDRTEGYDYSGNNNNISALSGGAAYNGSRITMDGLSGLDTDGSNDFATIQPNNTALCSFTPTTPWTVNFKLNIPGQMSGGVFLKWCYDGVGNGSGYMLRSSTNNRLGANNGTGFVQGTNASWTHITNNQTIYIQYVYHGNNTLTIHYSNATDTYTAYNSSFTGQFANTTSTEANSTTIGAQNAGALQLKAYFKEVQINMVAMSAEELKAWRNGTKSGVNPPNSTNLTALYKFLNQTSTNVTVTISPIRSTPSDYLGMQTVRSPYMAGMWCDTSGTDTYNVTCNQTEYQTYINNTAFGSGYGRVRNVFDFGNTLANWTGTNWTFNRITGSGQTNKNIAFQQDTVLQASRAGKHVIFNLEGMPLQTADNTSGCFYGLSSSGPSITAAENQRKCRPIANGSYVAGAGLVSRAIAQSVIEYGCFNYTSGVCAIELFNEFYLTQFFQGNLSASGTCSVRNQQVNELYNNGINPAAIRDAITAFGYNSSWIRYIAAPSQYNDNTCSVAIHSNFTSQHPYGSVNASDYDNFHVYAYDICGPSAVSALETDMQEVEAMAALGNYTNRYLITEGNIRCDSENVNGTVQYMSDMVSQLIYKHNSSTVVGDWIYQDASTTTESNNLLDEYILFRGSALTVPYGSSPLDTDVTLDNVTLTGAYYALKTYMTIPNSTDIHYCTASSANHGRCIYYRVNSTLGYILMDNRLGGQLDIDNITVTGFNISTAKRLTSGLAMRVNTTETVSGGKADPAYIYPYGATVYEITLQGQNISMTTQPTTYLVNVSEPTAVMFNLSINNPGNQSYNICWQNVTGGACMSTCQNTTTCTPKAAAYDTQGQYNISATVTGETNTLSMVWLLQINNTIRNISATYSPGSPLIMYINTPQSFTYTLNNSDNVSYTSTWTLNGTNLTACFNASGCSVSLPAAGAYALNVTIVGTNIISNLWSITVSSTSAATASACSNSSAGFVVGISFLVLLFGVVFVAGILYLVKSIREKSGFSPVDFVQENVAGLMFVAILLAIGVIIITLLAGQC